MRAEEAEAAIAAAMAAIAGAADLDQLKQVRLAHAGDRSPLALANREIGALPPQARKDAGKRVGQARGAVNKALARRQAAWRPSATPGCWSRRPSTSPCRPTGDRRRPASADHR